MGMQPGHQGSARVTKKKVKKLSAAQPSRPGQGATGRLARKSVRPASGARQVSGAEQPAAGGEQRPGTRPWVRAARHVGQALAPAWRPMAMGAEIARLPWTTVTLGRDEIGLRNYAFFTSPHLRYRFIPWKCLGVAIQALPASREAFLDGKPKHQVRTYVRRAEAAGYACRRFDPRDHQDEIRAIFASSPERQGAPVAFEAEAFARTAAEIPERFLGVFDHAGKLCGLTCAEVSGELAWMRVFIGHHDRLRDGICYALMAALVGSLAEERERRGRPSWLMYDFWFGKSPGMRYFIRRCGFRPHNVRWRLEGAA
jgi:hypothetical protein